MFSIPKWLHFSAWREDKFIFLGSTLGGHREAFEHKSPIQTHSLFPPVLEEHLRVDELLSFC